MNAFAKKLKIAKKALEFNAEIEGIATVAQEKPTHEPENITYGSMQKFRSLLNKELNTVFDNIHSKNVS